MSTSRQRARCPFGWTCEWQAKWRTGLWACMRMTCSLNLLDRVKHRGRSAARLCSQSALAWVHYFRRPLVDWLRMQVPKKLGNSFGRLGVGGNGGRDCHGGDVDAFPLETLKSAERQRSDTRLANAEGDELRIWRERETSSCQEDCP